MDIPSDKWQHYYTAEQMRWKDSRETFWIVFPLLAGIALATLFGILFVIVMPDRFSFGVSSLRDTLTLATIVITPFLPLIIGCVGLIIIFRVATAYFTALYLPPENTDVGKLIRRRLFGIPPLPSPLNSVFHYPFVIARDGRIVEKDMHAQWLGGPASLVIMDGTALYLERGNRFSRVVGPGIAFLEKYERIKDILDLRPQTYVAQVEAWTKDGIKVTFQVKILCRVGNVHGTVFMEDLAISPDNDGEITGENTPIYPCDPPCVRKASERRTTKRKIEEGKEQLYEPDIPWLDSTWGLIQGKLANYISKHHLEELFVSSKQGVAGQILSGEEREKLRNSLDQDLMKDIGVTLIDLQIENFKPEPLISGKRVEKWMTQWQATADVRNATADAAWTREVETARAEAQRDLIIQIADGLSEANPYTFTDSVLLALSGIIQESQGDPYAPSYLAEALDKIQELLKD